MNVLSSLLYRVDKMHDLIIHPTWTHEFHRKETVFVKKCSFAKDAEYVQFIP